MLPPHDSKIGLYLLLMSPMLGIVKADGIYRLVCFDDLRIDPQTLDVYGEHWGLPFDDFTELAREFPHETFPEILEFYPDSQSQEMLALAWKEAEDISPPRLALLAKVFKKVQYGRIKKTD